MLYELILSLHLALAQPQILGASNAVLSSHSINLENRYDNEFVSGVFKDNILLTLYYLDNQVTDKSQIDWDRINQPFKTQFTLKPGEKFAFHEKTLPDYSANVVKTTNAHFNGAEGFKSDGHLIGDGVCHLASLMYWAAEDAGLTAHSPSDHNFAQINEVPKEYGVGILSPNPLGNLYIVNNLDQPITFSFDFDGQNLTVTVSK
ncbi:MAG: VanW family protein [Candidatus Beckwithbacteria bacterium]|nr:VanW family protein [Candidatus Beckwithbacteria bacterium]